jgi:CheY-like chemotaxis protein
MTKETVALSSTLKATAPWRLLMLEDSPEDLALLLLELSRAGLSYSHTHVENKQRFDQIFVPGCFDAVISDYRLHSWTGMDAFARAGLTTTS